jgi:calcineurin-like phosphoesterase family protein
LFSRWFALSDFCIIKMMADIWFTSDFHLGHSNIIRFCKRPFANAHEMNEAIAERMNSCVKPDDTLYFLGDFFVLAAPGTWRRIENGLLARPSISSRGTTTRRPRKLQHLFASWSLLAEVPVGKQSIVLCHYAMRVWPHHARGSWHLYGHSHGNLPDDPLALSMDVGVDSHDFRLWHFNEIQAVMKAKADARQHTQRNQTTVEVGEDDC